jgi:hypothetical protein
MTACPALMKPYVPEDDRFVPKCQTVHMASPKTSKAYLFGEIHTGVYLHVASKKGPSLTPVVMAKAHGIPSLQCEAYSVELLWPTKKRGERGAKRCFFFFSLVKRMGNTVMVVH